MEGTISDTADVVLRSLWDDTGGHNLRGMLVEGRYRIEDIRSRTRLRSKVLTEIVKRLKENGIEFATQSLEIKQGS